jgi:hypothetical protein
MKSDLLRQLWMAFQKHTGIATDHLAISLYELPSTNAMEFGKIMPPVTHGQDWGLVLRPRLLPCRR